MNKFYLPEKYIINQNELLFDDTKNTDQYQNEVYKFARKFYDLQKLKNYVLDIGTGSGFKLIKYFNDIKTIGLEKDPNLGYLLTKYKKKIWYDNKKWSCRFGDKLIDLIIVSDLIEHLKDPEILINFINQFNYKFCIISTVDRSSLEKKFNLNGPPKNKHHVREWTFQEFDKYCKQYFKLKYHFISNLQQATQVVVCERFND